MKFKVGDKIIGNHKANCYSITKEGWTGTVLKLQPKLHDNEDYIQVTDLPDIEYGPSVLESYFDLAKTPSAKTLNKTNIKNLI